MWTSWNWSFLSIRSWRRPRSCRPVGSRTAACDCRPSSARRILGRCSYQRRGRDQGPAARKPDESYGRFHARIADAARRRDNFAHDEAVASANAGRLEGQIALAGRPAGLVQCDSTCRGMGRPGQFFQCPGGYSGQQRRQRPGELPDPPVGGPRAADAAVFARHSLDGPRPAHDRLVARLPHAPDGRSRRLLGLRGHARHESPAC